MGFSLASSNPLCRCYLNASPQQKGSTKIVSFVGNEKLFSVHFKNPQLSRKVQSRKRCLSSKVEVEGIDFEERNNPAEVKKEIEQCYKLIQRLGRGVVYLGSSGLGLNNHIIYKHMSWG